MRPHCSCAARVTVGWQWPRFTTPMPLASGRHSGTHLVMSSSFAPVFVVTYEPLPCEKTCCDKRPMPLVMCLRPKGTLLLMVVVARIARTRDCQVEGCHVGDNVRARRKLDKHISYTIHTTTARASFPHASASCHMYTASAPAGRALAGAKKE